jgi:hypothetical protein
MDAVVIGGSPMLKHLCICAALALDPETLPSLDSIDAKTDISAFMQPGVPNDLRLAALRRAWLADPAIRDFRDLAENDWDFTVAGSMFGFGELEPDLDGKMLAQAIGENPRSDQPATTLARVERVSILSRIFRSVVFQPSTFK